MKICQLCNRRTQPHCQESSAQLCQTASHLDSFGQRELFLSIFSKGTWLKEKIPTWFLFICLSCFVSLSVFFFFSQDKYFSNDHPKESAYQILVVELSHLKLSVMGKWNCQSELLVSMRQFKLHKKLLHFRREWQSGELPCLICIIHFIGEHMVCPGD